MVPSIYGKEHRLLKERMTDMEMNVEQELGIEPKVHESGGLCEPFFLSRDCTTCGKESRAVW